MPAVLDDVAVELSAARRPATGLAPNARRIGFATVSVMGRLCWGGSLLIAGS